MSESLRLESSDRQERGSIAALVTMVAVIGFIYWWYRWRFQVPDVYAPLGDSVAPVYYTGGPNMPGSASLDAPVLGPSGSIPIPPTTAGCRCGCGGGSGGGGTAALGINTPGPLANAPPAPGYVYVPPSPDWCYLPPCH